MCKFVFTVGVHIKVHTKQHKYTSKVKKRAYTHNIKVEGKYLYLFWVIPTNYVIAKYYILCNI